MSNQTTYQKYEVLGVEVDAITSRQAIDHIAEVVKSGKPAYVVKPYVEFIDRAESDRKLAAVLNGAELCLPDGTALIWAANYLYDGKPGIVRFFLTLTQIVLKPRALLKPLPEIFRGIKFTMALLDACEEKGLSVFLVGSPKQGHIAQTAAFVKTKYPKLKIAGHFTGNLNPELETELVKTLKSAKPDLILVGIGFPAQERLMSRLAGKLSHGVMVGEGGSFDYVQLGGNLPRAPRAIQRVGLEWLWRLVLQPWRLKRQASILHYLAKIYRAGRT